MNRIAGFILLYIALLAPAVMQAQTEPTAVPPGPAGAQPALPLDEAGNQIVAQVNDDGITLADFQRALDRNPSPFNDIEAYDAVAALELERLIQQSVIEQAAAMMEINVTEEDVQAEYEAMREIMPDDQEWQRWLMDNRFISEQEFRELTYDVLLTQKVQAAVVDNSAFSVPLVRARHILVATQAEAQALYNRLLNGEDFIALAQANSLDQTTSASGGELGVDGGFITPNDLTVPELALTAAQLPIGTISQPLETSLGWHIVQTLDLRQTPTTPEETARYNAAIFDLWLQEQLDAATIERYIYEPDEG